LGAKQSQTMMDGPLAFYISANMHQLVAFVNHMALGVISELLVTGFFTT
jgi:hypothetical protein